MSVTIKSEPVSGNGLRLHVEGDVTIYTVTELKEQLVEDIYDYSNIEIDMKSVTKIDTSGYQLLLLLEKETVKQDKKISILNPSEDVKRIFKLYNKEIKTNQ